MAYATQVHTSLRVARIVPSTAKSFILAEMGDSVGLQALFNTGAASPFDMNEFGVTLLYVSISESLVLKVSTQDRI